MNKNIENSNSVIQSYFLRWKIKQNENFELFLMGCDRRIITNSVLDENFDVSNAEGRLLSVFLFIDFS
jgi:hypothetical protein